MSGLFGVASRKDCVERLFYGTNYHSHLGTQYAGMAVWGRSLSKKIHDISFSQFKTRFFPELKGLKGTRGIGVISAQNPQPIVFNSRFGEFAVCVNGFIENADALARKLMADGESFSDSYNNQINISELAAKLIVRGTSVEDGIENHLFPAIKGSCSLLMLAKDGIWAARDRFGYSPLTVGESEDAHAVTTETTAFPNLGFKPVKYLAPGEIVFLDARGLRTFNKPGRVNQICSFLWIYTGFPASSYEGINVELVRERSGRCLAKNDTVRADMVAGVPDSGTTHAIGYAMESGIPFRRPLVKYTPGFDRSYMPPDQAVRDLIARMKLIAIREIVNGRSLVICDDSIVRGTQFKNFTIQKLRENGAREIHLRIACPPLMFPCRFNYSTRSANELATRRAIRALGGKQGDLREYLDENSRSFQRMVSWIARDLNVTSLRYQRLDDLVNVIGMPKERLCLSCWNGVCP